MEKLMKKQKKWLINDLRSHFRPEFLNRLDETILFKPLSKNDIGSIIHLLLADLNKRLAEREVSVELTQAAQEFVVEHTKLNLPQYEAKHYIPSLDSLTILCKFYEITLNEFFASIDYPPKGK